MTANVSIGKYGVGGMKEPGLGCILKGRDGYLEARSGMNTSVLLAEEHDGRELVGSSWMVATQGCWV